MTEQQARELMGYIKFQALVAAINSIPERRLDDDYCDKFDQNFIAAMTAKAGNEGEG